tara:strand:+ start:31288 stop:31740 length:453 start_codon:yes stop_codon:yes gene_type:complete
MKKIWDWLTGGVIKEVGTILDDLVTTKEEKLAISLKLQEIALKYAMDSDNLKASIILEEAKGNWLQRSWRPLIMLSFAAIVVFHYFLYPVLLAFNPELPDLPALGVNFWDLLQIGIGGYVVGRTAEKIVPQVLEYRKETKKQKEDASISS